MVLEKGVPEWRGALRGIDSRIGDAGIVDISVFAVNYCSEMVGLPTISKSFFVLLITRILPPLEPRAYHVPGMIWHIRHRPLAQHSYGMV